MTINHAIIIIAAMFATMLGWNIWWLFFAPESIIIKNKSMTTPKIENDRSRWELEQKLKQMESKREELLAEVASDYNEEKLRELNVLDHHIHVTSERVRGQWKVEAEQVQYAILQ